MHLFQAGRLWLNPPNSKVFAPSCMLYFQGSHRGAALFWAPSDFHLDLLRLSNVDFEVWRSFSCCRSHWLSLLCRFVTLACRVGWYLAESVSWPVWCDGEHFLFMKNTPFAHRSNLQFISFFWILICKLLIPRSLFLWNSAKPLQRLLSLLKKKWFWFAFLAIFHAALFISSSLTSTFC